MENASSQIKKAVILAGGLNSRMMPWSKIIPKTLLPIGRKLAIQYLVEECLVSGIKEIYIVVSSKNSLIKKYFTPNPKLNKLLKQFGKERALKEIEKIEALRHYLRFIWQPEPLGEAHAFLCVKSYLQNESVAVLLGDTIYYQSKIPAIKQIMEMPKNHKLLILGQGRMILTRQAVALFEKKYKAIKNKTDLRIMDVFKPDEIVFFNISAAKIALGTFNEYAGACANDIQLLVKKNE